MSKSKGNVVEPWDVISAHGADAFRWYYLTAQQPWSGYRFSVDTVGESVRQFLLTLWNTYSFWVLYANAENLGPADFPYPHRGRHFNRIAEEMTTAARRRTWIGGRSRSCSRLSATVRERMDEFDCTAAGRAIAEYVEELSNWYVRLSRRRFWDGDRAAFATLRHCLLEIAALLAPFTPFLADEIHLNLAGGEAEELGGQPDSVHLRDFPEVDAALADPELEAAMEAVRLTVELGRAARAQAKAKVRQPLRRAVIVANDAEREAISARADLVTAELNVKELDFVSEEADLVSYAVKPNYRSLGPRFGKRMPQVAAAVEALDPVHVAKVMADGGEIGISIDGDEHPIGPDEVSLALQPLDGYEVEAEAGHAVALQLELDDDLRREGLAREIVHAVQNARKSAGLDISDRIELSLGGDDELTRSRPGARALHSHRGPGHLSGLRERQQPPVRSTATSSGSPSTAPSFEASGQAVGCHSRRNRRGADSLHHFDLIRPGASAGVAPDRLRRRSEQQCQVVEAFAQQRPDSRRERPGAPLPRRLRFHPEPRPNSAARRPPGRGAPWPLRLELVALGPSPMMKSVFFESENFTQQ